MIATYPPAAPTRSRADRPDRASVPVEYFLDFIERDPLTSDADRAFFRSLLIGELRASASTPSRRA
jgi:hypothetical protein